MSGTSCSGSSYTVSGGSFTTTVAARTALALHTGAKLTTSTFVISAAANFLSKASTPVSNLALLQASAQKRALQLLLLAAAVALS